MAQPSPYDRQKSFTLLAAENPSDPYVGADLDEEFNAVKVTLDEIVANLALIQRDDGDLANASVGMDQLGASGIVGFTNAAWLTATAYTLTSSVFHNAILYKCIVAHTSGVFATDLAAAKWLLVADFGAYTLSDGAVTTAKIVDGAVTTAKLASLSVGASNIAAGAVTSAKLADLAVSYAKIQNITATDVLLGRATAGAGVIEEIALTAAGRALIDDVSAAAQRTTMGAQAQDAQLDQIAALTIAAGDVLYGSAANTVSNLAKGSNGQFLKLVAGLPAWGGGVLVGVQAFTTGSGTYTPTAGAKSGLAFLTGGGGGGGGAATTSTATSGAGGAAATAIVFISSLSAVSYGVGAGGLAGVNTGGTGGTGGQTTLSTMSANGGVGGVGATTSVQAAGGAGSSTTANATVTIPGAAGSPGQGLATATGGASFWGGGAFGPTTAGNLAGNTAVAPGAGGSGTYRDASNNVAGGVGAPGIVIVFEFA